MTMDYRPIICLQTLGLDARVTVSCNQFPTDLQTCCFGERWFQAIQAALVCWLVRCTLRDIYTSSGNSVAHREQLIYKLTSRRRRDCCELTGLRAQHHRSINYTWWAAGVCALCSHAQTGYAAMIMSAPCVLMTATGGVVLRTTVFELLLLLKHHTNQGLYISRVRAHNKNRYHSSNTMGEKTASESVRVHFYNWELVHCMLWRQGSSCNQYERTWWCLSVWRSLLRHL